MSITYIYVHTRIQDMATANELRVIIIFNIFLFLFYFRKYNNMVVKSHITKKKKPRSFTDAVFNMLIGLTFNDKCDYHIHVHC